MLYNKINSQISPDAIIYKDALIVNSYVGENCLIGDSTSINGTRLLGSNQLARRSTIHNSVFSYGSYAGQNSYINNTIIGAFTNISWDVSIGGGQHQYRAISMYSNEWWGRTFKSPDLTEIAQRKTIIGSDVWIGCKANIFGGLTIGDGAVVGASAVVTKDVLPYTIVAGCPAVVIKSRFDSETIETLLKIKWWNWPTDVIWQYHTLLQDELSKESLKIMEKIDREINEH